MPLILTGCGTTGISAPIWPTGGDGALIVAPGATAHLVQGGSYDFSSVTIGIGGSIIVDGDVNDNATAIGCSGNWTLALDASIVSTVGDNTNFAISQLMPDNYLFEYNPTPAIPGNGGASGTHAGGIGANGCGGGGGGVISNGSDGDTASGGPGGDGVIDPGGYGGPVYGGYGGDANPADGGGGGGGARGSAGSSVYIVVLGTVTVDPNSTFIGDGLEAGIGGNGAVPNGGGGGGGIGGYGAKLVCKSPGAALLFGSTSVLGSLGGVRGLGVGTGVNGQTGGNGVNGVVVNLSV